MDKKPLISEIVQALDSAAAAARIYRAEEQFHSLVHTLGTISSEVISQDRRIVSSQELMKTH